MLYAFSKFVFSSVHFGGVSDTVGGESANTAEDRQCKGQVPPCGHPRPPPLLRQHRPQETQTELCLLPPTFPTCESLISSINLPVKTFLVYYCRVLIFFSQLLLMRCPVTHHSELASFPPILIIPLSLPPSAVLRVHHQRGQG